MNQPIRRWMAGITLVLASGCATLPPPASGPEVDALTRAMGERRAQVTRLSALTVVDTSASRRTDLWPRFTAVMRYHAPDEFSLTGLSDFGSPLFRFSLGPERYELSMPGWDKPRTGDRHKRRDPIASLLTDLSRTLDGALGVDLKRGRLRVGPDGAWELVDRHRTERFWWQDGHVTRLEIHHKRRRQTVVTFDDFRPGAPFDMPYHIRVEVKERGTILDILVREWQVD